MKKPWRLCSEMSVRKKARLRNLGFHTLMIALCLTMVYPFLWALASSFKTSGQLYSGSPLSLIPEPFTLENYKRLFEVLPFGNFLVNSLVLSIVIPFSMILIASFTAYALTRMRFRGRNLLFILFISTMMLPGHVTLISNYKTVLEMNLINTYWALLLYNMFTAANAFNIFFFRQYFLTIPKDLENAAVIDGCSRVRVFFKIILPNAKPAIATTAILSFRNVWNSFLWPMLVLSDYDKQTLTVGLKYLKEWGTTSWGVNLAGAVLSIVPIIIIFVIFQKYFMSSVMNTGFGGK